MKESQIRRGRGRPRKTIRETIRKDLEPNELDPNMVYDWTLWRNSIHVADPDKALLLFAVVSELGSHGVGQAREFLLQFRILVLGFVALWDFCAFSALILVG